MYVLVEGPSYAVAVAVSLCILGKSLHAILQLMCCWPLYSCRNYCFAARICKCCCTYQLVPLLWVYLFNNSSLHAQISCNFKQCCLHYSKHYTTKLILNRHHITSITGTLLTHWHTAYSCTLHHCLLTGTMLTPVHVHYIIGTLLTPVHYITGTLHAYSTDATITIL